MNARRAAAIALAACACATEEIELPRAPSAFAGFDAFVTIGEPVALDASLSADPDGDALTFSWSIAAEPVESRVSIGDPSSRVTSIVPDVRGTWVIALSVSDGRLSSRDLVAFTATASTASTASIARPQLSLEPPTRNEILSTDPLVLRAVSSAGTLEPYLMRVPAGATPEEISLTVVGNELGFFAPRPGEYWIGAVLRNDHAVSPPAIAVIAVFDEVSPSPRPRAVLTAPRTAKRNSRVLFDGRSTEGTTTTRWNLIADPSNGMDQLLDVATGCPTGACRLLLPSKLGLYVVTLEVEEGATAVHALEVIE